MTKSIASPETVKASLSVADLRSAIKAVASVAGPSALESEASRTWLSVGQSTWLGASSGPVAFLANVDHSVNEPTDHIHCIPWGPFKRIAELVTSDQVDVELSNLGNVLKVFATRQKGGLSSVFNLATPEAHAVGIPRFAAFDVQGAWKAEAADVARAIDQCKQATGKATKWERGKTYKEGVFLECHNDAVSFVATDGDKMTRVRVATERQGVSPDKVRMIPLAALKAILALCKGAGERGQWYESGIIRFAFEQAHAKGQTTHYLRIRTESMDLRIALDAFASLPTFSEEDVFPTERLATATFHDVPAFLRAVKVAAKGGDVTLVVMPECRTVAVRSGDGTEVLVPASGEGEVCSRTFDGKALLAYANANRKATTITIGITPDVCKQGKWALGPVQFLARPGEAFALQPMGKPAPRDDAASPPSPELTSIPTEDESVGVIVPTEEDLFHSTYIGPRWTYAYRNRPFNIGCQPKGFIYLSSGLHPEYRNGTIDYPRPLTDKEVYDFELVLVSSPQPTSAPLSAPPAHLSDDETLMPFSGPEWADTPDAAYAMPPLCGGSPDSPPPPFWMECDEYRYSHHDFDFSQSVGTRAQKEVEGFVNVVQMPLDARDSACMSYADASKGYRQFPTSTPGESARDYARRLLGDVEVVKVARFRSTEFYAAFKAPAPISGGSPEAIASPDIWCTACWQWHGADVPCEGDGPWWNWYADVELPEPAAAPYRVEPFKGGFELIPVPKDEPDPRPQFLEDDDGVQDREAVKSAADQHGAQSRRERVRPGGLEERGVDDDPAGDRLRTVRLDGSVHRPPAGGDAGRVRIPGGAMDGQADPAADPDRVEPVPGAGSIAGVHAPGAEQLTIDIDGRSYSLTRTPGGFAMTTDTEEVYSIHATPCGLSCGCKDARYRGHKPGHRCRHVRALVAAGLATDPDPESPMLHECRWCGAPAMVDPESGLCNECSGNLPRPDEPMPTPDAAYAYPPAYLSDPLAAFGIMPVCGGAPDDDIFSEWIVIKSKPPEPRRDVLLYMPGNADEVEGIHVGYLEEAGDFSTYHITASGELVHPTLWMPLPAPPGPRPKPISGGAPDQDRDFRVEFDRIFAERDASGIAERYAQLVGDAIGRLESLEAQIADLESRLRRDNAELSAEIARLKAAPRP